MNGMLITKWNQVAILAVAASWNAWAADRVLAQSATGDVPSKRTPATVDDDKSLLKIAQQPHGENRGSFPEGALARLGDTHLRHGGGIRASALAPDGKTLATAGGGVYAVVIWDVDTGKVVRRLQGLQADTFIRPALAFSPDGTLLAYLQGPH